MRQLVEAKWEQMQEEFLLHLFFVGEDGKLHEKFMVGFWISGCQENRNDV